MLTVPPLGQAGGKRLHFTLHLTLCRIRRRKQRIDVQANLNKQDRNTPLDFTALHSLKSARALTLGLTLKPMFPRTIFSPYRLAARQRGGFACSVTGRSSICSNVPADPGPSRETLSRKPLAEDCAPLLPCFSCVAHQPQRPVVKALQKV